MEQLPRVDQISNKYHDSRSSCVMSTWADAHHADAVEELFPKFMNVCASTEWKTTIRNVIHWYVASNKNVALLETSVVMAQDSLDHLAWMVLVQQLSKITAKDYRALPVHERIRQLLHHCQIPT
jgi:hypothetical protein